MYIIRKGKIPHWVRGKRHWTYAKRKANRAHRHAYKMRLKAYAGGEEPVPVKAKEILTDWEIW